MTGFRLQDFPEFCGHFTIVGIYAGIRDADVLKISDAGAYNSCWFHELLLSPLGLRFPPFASSKNGRRPARARTERDLQPS
jgi:hypothetical protein